MNRIGGLVVVVVSTFGVEAAFAECSSDQSKPKWATKTPKGYKFRYAVGEAQGVEIADARQGAITRGVTALLQRDTIRVSAQQSVSEQTDVKRTDKNGEQTYDENTKVKVTDDLQIKVGTQTIEGLEVVETYEEVCEEKHLVRALVRVKRKVPRSGSPPNPALSAWIPGLAQFQKEETLKGTMILVGEGALIGGAVTFFILSADSLNKAEAATRQADRDFFNDQSATRNTIGLVCAIAAGGLYVYNVLDGLLTPDTINYAQNETTTPDLWFAAGPTEGGAVGSLSLRF